MRPKPTSFAERDIMYVRDSWAQSAAIRHGIEPRAATITEQLCSFVLQFRGHFARLRSRSVHDSSRAASDANELVCLLRTDFHTPNLRAFPTKIWCADRDECITDLTWCDMICVDFKPNTRRCADVDIADWPKRGDWFRKDNVDATMEDANRLRELLCDGKFCNHFVSLKVSIFDAYQFGIKQVRTGGHEGSVLVSMFWCGSRDVPSNSSRGLLGKSSNNMELVGSMDRELSL